MATDRIELIAHFRKLRGEIAQAIDTIPVHYDANAARRLRWQAEVVELELDSLIRSLESPDECSPTDPNAPKS